MRAGYVVTAVATMGLALGAVAPSLGIGSTAGAESAVSNLKDSLRLGTHWSGPELSLEDLEGRVVLIEDWGYN